MSDPARQPEDDRLDRLRRFRTYERDLSLGFMKDQFKRELQQPHRQLQKIIPVWRELAPEQFRPKCRLERFSRGVLHVCVDSSATLYELDRLMRDGLKRQLIQQCPGLRNVSLRVSYFGAQRDGA